MSTRLTVLAAVGAAAAEWGRAVTFEEVRACLEPRGVPRNLATALGSLVRTGHVSAVRARDWSRESRRLYWIAGEEPRIDRSIVNPSVPELVYQAVHSLFSTPERARRPVASSEIRRHLAESEVGRTALARPTYVPTALNLLRKGCPESPPLLQCVQVPGVRAQHWVPTGAEFALGPQPMATGTATDRLADLVTRASSLSADGLVSARDVAWLARRFRDHGIAAGDVPRLLAEAARPVFHRGSRRPRANPAVVRVGEVDGRSLYAPAGSRWEKREDAQQAFAWRQLAEAWSEAGVEAELHALAALGPDSPWNGVRRAAIVPLLAGLSARLNGTAGDAHPVEQVENDRAAVRDAIRAASVALGVEPPAGTVAQSPPAGAWLTASEAGNMLREAFGLVDDPPVIEAGFLTGEVRRVRAAEVIQEIQGLRRHRGESWRYDRVTLLVAGALRWADAETGAMVSLGAELLGHVRSAANLRPLIDEPLVSVTELAAAHAVLGDEAGRSFLESLVRCSTSPTMARRFAVRGVQLLDWIRSGCVGRVWPV